MIFPFIQFLTPAGDGSGNPNQTGNFSVVSPGFFFVSAPPGTQLTIYSLVFVLGSGGVFGQSGYGSIAGGLINGLRLEARFGNLVIDSLDGFRIRRNRHFPHLGDVSFVAFPGPGSVLQFTTRFASLFGAALKLSGADHFGIRLTDDLSSLDSQIVSVHGVIDVP